MKSWYPISFNPDTFESGHLIFNHDTHRAEKHRGVFQEKWSWGIYKGCSVRIIMES